MTRPSYLLDIPADEYHAATKRNEFTTSHRLNLFRRCPALYKKTIDGLIVEGDTASFQLGRATHAYILEGADKFATEFTVSDGPINEKTGMPYGRQTKAYTDWYAEQPKPVISTEDFALIEKMSAAVHAHEAAAALLADGIAEGTIRTEWFGLPVQSRLDWFDPEHGALVDLKTCADLDRFGFDIRDFGYTHQLAFYARVLRFAGYGGDLRCCFVAVEKKEPFRVAVYELYPYTITEANDAGIDTKLGPGNDQVVLELLDCRAHDIWPTRYEQVIRY